MTKPWYKEYEDRVTTIEAAIALVPKDGLLLFGSYGAEPGVLIAALRQQGLLHHARALQATEGTSGELVEAASADFELITHGPDRRAAAAIPEGHVDYVPSSIYRMCRWVEAGRITPDVAYINVTLPDDDGYCSFGVTADFATIAALQAKRVVAQVNQALPRIASAPVVHVTRLDAIVEVSEPLRLPSPQGTIDTTSQRIGRLLADLVPDRATIEVGVGNVPAAFLAALAEHSDLGVHTGRMSDGIMHLIKSGAITGAYKPIDQGLAVANVVTGSADLYEFAVTADQVCLRSAQYTHDPMVIAQLNSFVAVNSAIQVDLRGQINAEVLQHRQVAGTGGSLDFVTGGSLAMNGSSVFALPATAGDGLYSRIVATMQDNGVVTIPGSLVDHIVTEYGVASLAGRSLRSRARALIEVAHPNFRADLARAAGI